MRFVCPITLSCLASGTCLLVGCSAEPSSHANQDNLVLYSNFESYAGWNGAETPSLTRERAYSGQYSIKTDTNIEYSLTYSDLVARLPPGPLTKIRVSAWVFSTDPGDSQFTVQLKRSLQDNTVIFNHIISLGQIIKKRGEWTHLEEVMTLPAEVSTANQLRIYVWRASAPAPVYLDDLTITREP